MADEFQLGSDSWRDTSSPSSSAAFRGGSLAAFPAGGQGVDWNDLLRGDKGGEEDSSSIYGLLLSEPIQHQNHSYLYPNPINSGQTWSGSGNIHFTNATPFWNSLSAPSSFATSSFDERPKKNVIETTNKRSRSDTTSSPTMSSSNFKVKKEKMGDKVTALQQLVSPFGKTDTASVLSEAIDNIKFLHDQVCALLSAPYTSNEAPSHILHQQQNYEKCKDGDDEDLRNRGLCLVPISSVTNETT